MKWSGAGGRGPRIARGCFRYNRSNRAIMPASPTTTSRVSRALRFVAMSVLVVAGAFFALLLAIRLVAFPQIENRRGEIAQWLSAGIG